MLNPADLITFTMTFDSLVNKVQLGVLLEKYAGPPITLYGLQL